MLSLHADSTGELDQITSGNKVASEERREGVDRIVDTSVSSEVGLDLREQDHGPVSTSTVEGTSPGETDGVVESQTERLVSVFTALTLKEIRLQVIEQREEYTALNIEKIA